MANEQINEYLVEATEFTDGSFMDIDQLIGVGVWESQKMPLSVFQAASGNIYVSDGTLTESRLVTMDGNTLQFTGGQLSFGRAATLLAPAGVNPVVNVDFNTGNYQTIDLENATEDVTVTLTNQLIGGMYTIKIIQGANLVDINWPATVKWATGQALIVTTIDDAHDRVNLIFDNPNYDAVFADNFQ